MRQRGFEILAPYADAVDRYARKLADDALPRTKGITGKNIYGPIYRELGRILKHSDFNRFREILRNVSAERLPLGPRDNIFGALPTRKWHSIYSASIEYDMSPSMMDRLLRQSGVPVLRRRVAYSGSLIGAVQLAEFMSKYRSAHYAEEARPHLALPVHCWETLIGKHILKPFMKKSERKDITAFCCPGCGRYDGTAIW
ncbi:hypothetical protein ACXHXM_33110